jgi:AcrR family transcriptional regulator
MAVEKAVEKKVDEKRQKLAGKIDEKSQRLAGKIDQKAQQLAAKVDEKAQKLAAKVERHGDAVDRIAPVALAAFELWTRERPGRRQPRHTLAQIADAALHVADTEGVEALSMRRLAAELGAGTMTLYHYVHTKDELLALLADRVMGELVLGPGELPDGWREGLSTIARRTCDVLLAHPWVFDIAEDPTFGPNGLRHFDQSLRATAGLQVPTRQRLEILQLVDEYVFGFCLHAREDAALARDETAADEVRRYVGELVATGDYPEVAALMAEHGIDELWEEFARPGGDRERERFERNLVLLLDGIERSLPSATGSAPTGT